MSCSAILLCVCFNIRPPREIYLLSLLVFFFFFNDTATTEIYTLSLHDALPICERIGCAARGAEDVPPGRVNSQEIQRAVRATVWAFGVACWAAPCPAGAAAPRAEQRLLYVAAPGIRNYVEWGGKGILVYDIDRGH